MLNQAKTQSAGGFPDRNPSEETNKRPPVGFRHWYVYECADTTETRGKRGARKPPCGHFNVRATKYPIDEYHNPQGAPCQNCGRRQRLNKGIVKSNDAWIQEPVFGRNRETGVRYITNNPWQDSDIPNLKARKAWALSLAETMNAHRLAKSPNALEQTGETIEIIPETIEERGDLIG
jgi:hypothetical protein